MNPQERPPRDLPIFRFGLALPARHPDLEFLTRPPNEVGVFVPTLGCVRAATPISRVERRPFSRAKLSMFLARLRGQSLLVLLFRRLRAVSTTSFASVSSRMRPSHISALAFCGVRLGRGGAHDYETMSG